MPRQRCASCVRCQRCSRNWLAATARTRQRPVRGSPTGETAMETLLWIIAVPFLALVIYTVWGIVRMQSPTKGWRIDRAAQPGKALVVIDVQEDFTHLKSKYAWDPTYLDQRLAAINRAASRRRRRASPSSRSARCWRA